MFSDMKLNNMYSLVLMLYKLKKGQILFQVFLTFKEFKKKTFRSNFSYRFHIGIAFATKQPVR